MVENTQSLGNEMATTSATNPDQEDKRALLRLEMALEGRRFEIGLFWQRSLFFWGFNAAALVALGSSTLGNRPEIALAMTCFGVICSLTWSLANRGSKYWHEAWEQKVQREERQIVSPLYAQEEALETKGIWLSARRYSVSRLAMALADYVFFLWLCLLVYQAAAMLKWSGLDTYHTVGVVAFLIASGAFAIGIVVKGRSGRARFGDSEFQ